jgi:hypothetical protein
MRHLPRPFLPPTDIDYEYPKANEAEGFQRFLKELKKKFPDHEVSVAISAIPKDGESPYLGEPKTGKGGYDGLGSVNSGDAKVVDFWNIMT